MTRPTWATVVGVIGIILGCFGILGAGQLVMMPKIMEIQKTMLAEMEKTIEQQQGANPQQAPPVAMFKMMHRFFELPPWYQTWCIVAGVLSLFVSGFYVFACIRLLQTSPSAIGLFYAAAGLAIALALVKGMVAVAGMSFMGLAVMFWSMFGVVINVVLLVVVGSGDKQAFGQPDA